MKMFFLKPSQDTATLNGLETPPPLPLNTNIL